MNTDCENSSSSQMETYSLNTDQYVEKVTKFLNYFENNKNEMFLVRGLCMYGEHGIGKTTLIMNILKSLNYEVIYYTSSDVRDKQIVEEILNLNRSNISIVSYFKQMKRNVIVIDNIENMGNSEKGGVSQLIKLIRPKKTKPQQKEPKMMIPIICISGLSNDKIIKELLKICYNVHMKTPSRSELLTYYSKQYPSLNERTVSYVIDSSHRNIRKCNMYFKLYLHNPIFIRKLLYMSSFITYNAKDVVNLLLKKRLSICDHNIMIREQDRTSVSLFIHENIIDYLPEKKNVKLDAYTSILDNICYVDYMDRIIFQKQIWILNELSSVIKNISNTNYLHDIYELHNINPIYKTEDELNENNEATEYTVSDLRFTKVLTKYSTEYNNYTFLYNLSQKLQLDQRDLFNLFNNIYSDDNKIDLYNIIYNYDLSKLEIDRMKRFLTNRFTDN